MGSFNVKCQISNQTITPGQVAYLFPILQQYSYYPIQHSFDRSLTAAEYSTHMGFCHSISNVGAFWSGFSLPLTASYEDCGEFSLEPSDENYFALTELFSFLINKTALVKEGENSSHAREIDFKKEADALNFSLPVAQNNWEKALQFWSRFQDLAHDHRIIGRDFMGNACAFALSAVHSKAFEQALSVDLEELMGSWFQDRSLFLSNKLKDLIDRGETGLSPAGFSEIRTICDSLFKRSETGVLFSGLISALLCPSFELPLKSLVDFGAKVACFLTFCNEHHLKFAPMDYAGQDYRNEIGRSYATFVSNVAKSIEVDLDLD